MVLRSFQPQIFWIWIGGIPFLISCVAKHALNVFDTVWTETSMGSLCMAEAETLTATSDSYLGYQGGLGAALDGEPSSLHTVVIPIGKCGFFWRRGFSRLWPK